MPDPQVTIEPSMAHHFQLEAWDAIDNGGKLALGDYLSERLQMHGWGVPEPMFLGSFGPSDSPRSVLQWYEPMSGMTFSLIPGGTFRPGDDDARLERLAEMCEAEDLEDPEDYGFKTPVAIAPFFMATELVRPKLPGLRSVTTLSDRAFNGEDFYGYDFMGDAIEFPWASVEPVMSHYGWSLPTSIEFEWATCGGDDSLFYWGDDLPQFDHFDDQGWGQSPEEKAAFDAIMSASFDQNRPQTWPWCNRFGLVAMLPRQTWCAPSNSAEDSGVSRFRGAAAHAWPWQGCGEWLMLLTHYESQTTKEDKSAIRPVIRLDQNPEI